MFHRKMLRLQWVIGIGMLWMMMPVAAHAQVDFIQKYERGKALLRQKLYFDAVKELYLAVYKSKRGRRHFGAHYYLALAYYWRPHIQLAMQVLDQTKPLIKNPIQKSVYNKLLRRIQALYGYIKIVPEVDPDEVGRLQIDLKPKIEFSNRHKKRYFRIIMKQIKKKGGLALDNKPFYLPKGDYSFAIKQPQCLKYALVSRGQTVREFSVDAPLSMNLKERTSCKCQGGQKLVKEGKKLSCACPAGTAWDKKDKRCEIAKTVNPWPWIGIGVGVLVAGGVAIGLAIYFSQEYTTYQLLPTGGQSGAPSTPVWAP